MLLHGVTGPERSRRAGKGIWQSVLRLSKKEKAGKACPKVTTGGIRGNAGLPLPGGASNWQVSRMEARV